MKIEELIDEGPSRGKDPCMIAAKSGKVNGVTKPNVFPFSLRRNGASRHVILLENEITGLMEYKLLWADGTISDVLDSDAHLGGVGGE